MFAQVKPQEKIVVLLMHDFVLNLAVCIALSITYKQRNSTMLMLTDQFKAKSDAAVIVFWVKRVTSRLFFLFSELDFYFLSASTFVST